MVPYSYSQICYGLGASVLHLWSLSPVGDEHYPVSFPFIENDDYYDVLFSFGESCACKGPLRIRAEMKRRIHAMAALHAK